MLKNRFYYNRDVLENGKELKYLNIMFFKYNKYKSLVYMVLYENLSLIGLLRFNLNCLIRLFNLYYSMN